MDYSPLYFESREMTAFLLKHLPSRELALSIKCHEGVDLFWAESLGFKHLVGIDTEFWHHQEYYLGYQEDKHRIERLELKTKPLNRIFKAKYSFIMGDVLTHNFQGKKFDLIFCSYFLNDFAFGSQLEVMMLIKNLLNPNGILFVRLCSDKSDDDLPGKPNRFFRENNVVNDKYSDKKRYLLTKQAMDQLFHDANLEVLDAKERSGNYRFFLKNKRS